MAAPIPKRDQPVKHYFTGKQYEKRDYDGSDDREDSE